MKKHRKSLLVTLTALTLVVIIGTTLGLQYAEKSINNVFTFNGENPGTFDIELKEPEWEATGSTMAQDIEPGMIIPKDPQVTNLSDEDIFVAYKLIFTRVDVDENGEEIRIKVPYSEFTKIAKINFNYPENPDTWKPIDPRYNDDNGNVYIFNVAKVKPGETTVPCINSIEIKGDVDSSELYSFDIEVQAFAIPATEPEDYDKKKYFTWTYSNCWSWASDQDVTGDNWDIYYERCHHCYSVDAPR